MSNLVHSNTGTVNTGKTESFSLMKQWIFSKFSTVSGDSTEGGSEEGTSDKAQGSLPTIVISRGSEKSLNRLYQTPPSHKKPSPLAKTWSNYSDTNRPGPASAPHHVNKASFWYSPYAGNKSTHKPQIQSCSVPGTPMDSAPVTKPTRSVKSADGYLLKSPVFRFSQKNKVPLVDAPSLNGSQAWSRSQLDSPSICGACGQRKFYGSRDFVGFDCSQQNLVSSGSVKLSNTRPPGLSSQLALRRTSSCRLENEKKTGAFSLSAKIKKAASNIDVQKHRTNPAQMNKSRKVKRTGSKDRSRSTISLTRSWSINLDSFRIVRNDSAKSDSRDYSRKMSLNDNELRRITDRRRSSLLRLLCIDNVDKRTDQEDANSIESVTRQNSEDDTIDYSPKVTRSDKFVNGDPVEEFRSTFETDSIRVPSIYGQVKLMFQFFNEKDELHVTILKGSNVARDHPGKLGIFTKVCLMPGKIQSKVGGDKHDTHDPVFYELFVFKMTLGELLDRQLRVKMYNKPGIFSLTQPIGEFSLPLYPFDLTAVSVIWQNLSKSKGQQDTLDEFDFSPLVKEETQGRGLRQLFCGLGNRK